MSTISLRYTANGHPSAPAIYRETRADGSTWIVCDGETVDVDPARAAILAAAWGPSVWVAIAPAEVDATPSSATRGAATATRASRRRMVS
jgi:hypothetical protein